CADDHEDRGDEYAIEDHDAGRSGADTALRVENRGRDRDHARNYDVREGQTRVVDGEEKALAVWREAWGQEANELRREPNADDRDGAEAEHHRTEHRLGEKPRAVDTALGENAQPHRHEGGIERTFRQQSAKQVRDLQRRAIGAR